MRSHPRRFGLSNEVLECALELLHHRAPVTMRVQLQTLGIEPDLIARGPRVRVALQVPSVKRATQILDERPDGDVVKGLELRPKNPRPAW